MLSGGPISLLLLVLAAAAPSAGALGRNILRRHAVQAAHAHAVDAAVAAEAACAAKLDVPSVRSEVRDAEPAEEVGCLGDDGRPLRRSDVAAAATPRGELHQLAFIDLPESPKTDKQGDQTIVWISGYARSGTSTALSMIAAEGAERFDRAVDDLEDEEAAQVHQFAKTSSEVEVEKEEHQDGSVFAMFEPCHFADYFWQGGDKVNGALAKEGCKGLIKAISNCDFSEVQSLHLWANRHSVHVGVREYTEEAAHLACKAANVVAYKTIYYGHDLQEKAVPLADADPRLRVISVVRDPRGIYASWRTTWPFSYRIGRHLMINICDNFAKNINVRHPQIHQIVFEDLAKDPERVTRQVYDFLGMNFSTRQQRWIAKNFNANCGEEAHFTDCKTNSSSHIEAWTKVMEPEERRFFSEYPACIAVAKQYGYPLS